MFKVMGLRMNVTTAILKEVILCMGFAFVNKADLLAGADALHTTGTTIIARC